MLPSCGLTDYHLSLQFLWFSVNHQDLFLLWKNRNRETDKLIHNSTVMSRLRQLVVIYFCFIYVTAANETSITDTSPGYSKVQMSS